MINKQGRRAIVITVWGSPGSGKTVYSALLSRYLTRDHDHAILISPDQTVPIIPVLFPKDESEQTQSIGPVLESEVLDTSIIAPRVKVVKSYPYIGILGYAPGDTPYTYADYSYEKVLKLIENVCDMTDYIIIDCTNRVKEIFTPAAIECADIAVGMFTPDLVGIAYHKAQESLLADKRFHPEYDFIVAGNSRPYNAVDEMETNFGRLDAEFPWSKFLNRAAGDGSLFTAGQYCTTKHMQALRLVQKACNEIKQFRGGVTDRVEQPTAADTAADTAPDTSESEAV